MNEMNLALATSCLRAKVEETKNKNGIFQDWESIRLWQEMQQRSQLVFCKEIDRQYNWRSQNAIAIRSQVIDLATSNHLAAKSHPIVVELGCGFSTRSSRYNADGKYLWYEIDVGEIIDLKSQYHRKTSHLVAANIPDLRWVDTIDKNSDPTSILFIAEGLFMYFKKERLARILRDLSRTFLGSSLIFDGMTTAYSRMLESSSVPIRWLAEDLALDFPEFRVTQKWNLLQLYPKRWRHWRFLSNIKSIREADFIVLGNLNKLLPSDRSLTQKFRCQK